MELRDLLPLPDLEGFDSILCVQPHPDDNEVGAGATIAKLAAKGCKITYLTVTDGSMGTIDPRQDPKALALIRKEEVRKSAAILGALELIFLDFPDGGYTDEKTLCSSIVSVIRRVKPQVVLTVDPFLPYEAHPDHRKIGMATAEACIFSAFPGFSTEEETSTWTISAVAFHSTAYPNTFINVDETFEKKFIALSQHASQFDETAIARLKYYFDFKARGYAQGKPFERAEAFKVLSTDCLHVNVDAIVL